MIPRTIQIKNFLSYGPELQTISFVSYHLICLSGKNGHGKSALLDAMTWALWGTARKITNTPRADQGLLHLGQTDMMVIFDFEVNNTCYRIKRCYEIIYGKPQTSLEFGLINSDDILVPLTDKTIRTTQACIDTTIGLDFDTFVNSTFLRQGNANEFSKRSPKDRKEIITTILGLQTYDTLRKAASDKVKEATIQKTTLCALQEKLNKELEQTNDILLQASTLEQNLIACQTLYTELTHTLHTNAQEKKQLAEQEKNKEICSANVAQCNQTFDRLMQELHTTRNAWRTTHRTQLLCADPLALEQKKRDLLRLIEHYTDVHQKTLQFKEQILLIRESIQKSTHELNTREHIQQRDITFTLERLKSDLSTITTTIKRLETDSNTYQNELQHAERNKTLLAAQLQKQTTIQQAFIIETATFEKRKETYQRLVALGNMLRNELNTIQQKISLSHDKEDPSCPLCEQNLSGTRRRFLINKLTIQAYNIHHRCERLKRVLPKLKELLIAQHETIVTLQKKLDTLIAQQVTLDNTTQKIDELSQKITANQLLITQELHKQQDIQHTINVQTHNLTISIETDEIKLLKTELSLLHEHLTLLTNQATSLQYDQKSHEIAVSELKELDQQLHNQDNLKQQHAWQSERKHTIISLCAQLKKQKLYRADLTHELVTYAHLEQQYASLAVQEQTLKEKLDACVIQKELLFQEKGRLESEQKKLLLVAEEHKQQQENILILEEHMHDYQVIAHAASKDGIQALLIEDAIPEIEQEANNLLSKLTNNQAHISIESLRDLKKGGTRETLDINISDSIGIRPYEMFSGGEAFRIDFALRIAISKLLARRAGTALQTLIIDEGFGSQDEEGLSLIMDALYKIQDDFAKIIIVSHLPSMKDQFPVHFVVEKNARGSLVHVIEQG